MKHKLKIELQFFEAKVAGHKLFEIRNNDRDFQKGDTVTYCNVNGSPFGGEWEITYVTNYNQKDGYVVFGEKDVSDE